MERWPSKGEVSISYGDRVSRSNLLSALKAKKLINFHFLLQLLSRYSHVKNQIYLNFFVIIFRISLKIKAAFNEYLALLCVNSIISRLKNQSIYLRTCYIVIVNSGKGSPALPLIHPSTRGPSNLYVHIDYADVFCRNPHRNKIFLGA